jgi:hypothetical protein
MKLLVLNAGMLLVHSGVVVSVHAAICTASFFADTRM